MAERARQSERQAAETRRRVCAKSPGSKARGAVGAVSKKDGRLEALLRFGKPRTFNTVRGSTFTAEAFASKLVTVGVEISMDGRGRFMDNTFIERLWRSIKYEEVHLKAYADGREARSGISCWMNFYNRAWEHPSGYGVEKKRLCWPGCDPAGYLGFSRARFVMD